ncbi:hypothetical protein [Amycolatopsis sp. NPDC054798]
MTNGRGRGQRGTVFPIVEAYGFPYDSNTRAAQLAWAAEACPFSGTACEKKRQYGYGYCSVTYAASWDEGNQRTYAVCDHRLDGEPVNWAVQDHFGTREAILVPEVTVTAQPKLNIDYVAFSEDADAENGVDLIAIETQAIDLRGGGVGPAWDAWENNDTDNWRQYFTAEAQSKNRRDTVDYGVNTGNVYKRLATQVAEKGAYLRQVNVPLYVVMQGTILNQLRNRVKFEPTTGDPWDITFAGFDYDGTITPEGQHRLDLSTVVRTSYESYIEAMFTSNTSTVLRDDFIQRVKKKVRVDPEQVQLFPEI